MQSMLKFRPATKKDQPQILKILKDLDLFYPTLALKNFWVAEKDHQIIGCVQLEEYDNFQFLGSLAVVEKLQGQDIGKFIMQEILKKQRKNIYLHTIIPDFFRKFDFTVADTYPPNLPSKDRYECEYCHPEKCVCMVKKYAS